MYPPRFVPALRTPPPLPHSAPAASRCSLPLCPARRCVPLAACTRSPHPPHPAARVVIKGYASPEGSAEINAKIAQSRAEAVEKILVNKYHIAADRITAEGQGVGDMFSEPDWNRVSICTIDDKSR